MNRSILFYFCVFCRAIASPAGSPIQSLTTKPTSPLTPQSFPILSNPTQSTSVSLTIQSAITQSATQSSSVTLSSTKSTNPTQSSSSTQSDTSQIIAQTAPPSSLSYEQLLNEFNNLKNKATKFQNEATKFQNEGTKFQDEANLLRAETFVLQCGKDQRYAIKFFELLIDYVNARPFTEFMHYAEEVKKELFAKLHETKQNIRIKQFKKNYCDLTTSENKTYYSGFLYKKMTRKEKWLVFSRWIAFSDEYKLVQDGNRVKRLAILVEEFRAVLKKSADGPNPLKPDILADCISRNWDRISNILKVEPSFNFSKLYKKLLKISNAKDNMAEYCAFLLETIIKQIPVMSEEKKV